jgi:hypothetical protein
MSQKDSLKQCKRLTHLQPSETKMCPQTKVFRSQSDLIIPKSLHRSCPSCTKTCSSCQSLCCNQCFREQGCGKCDGALCVVCGHECLNEECDSLVCSKSSCQRRECENCEDEGNICGFCAQVCVYCKTEACENCSTICKGCLHENMCLDCVSIHKRCPDCTKLSSAVTQPSSKRARI